MDFEKKSCMGSYFYAYMWFGFYMIMVLHLAALRGAGASLLVVKNFIKTRNKETRKHAFYFLNKSNFIAKITVLFSSLLLYPHLATVVQRLDNAIHRINHYPADKC